MGPNADPATAATAVVALTVRGRPRPAPPSGAPSTMTRARRRCIRIRPCRLARPEPVAAGQRDGASLSPWPETPQGR
jgi:hypothetical protein